MTLDEFGAEWEQFKRMNREMRDELEWFRAVADEIHEMTKGYQTFPTMTICLAPGANHLPRSKNGRPITMIAMPMGWRGEDGEVGTAFGHLVVL